MNELDDSAPLDDRDDFTTGDGWRVIHGEHTYYGPVAQRFPGERVITPSLRANLTPVEESELSGDRLVSWLRRKADWYFKGSQEVAGWSAEDLVGHVLEMSLSGNWNGNRTVLTTWMQQKFTKIRRNAAAETPTDDEGSLEREAPEFVTTRLGEAYHTWLQGVLTSRQYSVVVLYVERNLSHEEIASELGMARSSVTEMMSRATERIKNPT
jgi:DNA-directed RNA polymerase specialized sigma24 family protein